MGYRLLLMKKIQTFLVAVCITISAFGQNFDSLLVAKKQPSCLDISYGSYLYFVEYMKENKIDTAKSLVDYWESKCGLKKEPVYRAKLLLALKTGTFNDSLLSKMSLSHIFSYQNRMKIIESSDIYPYDFDTPPLYHKYNSYGFYRELDSSEQNFDNYTRELASELKSNYPEESMEYLLTEFYSDNWDDILLKIQQPAYQESSLAKQYKEEIERIRNMTETHLAWITGIWIPTGALTKIGIHPELGFQIGWKRKKMNYDFTMAFKFLKSPNDYYARRDKSSDSWELTNRFFGGYIGFDVGRDVYAKNGHELQLTGGIAFDGFDALNEDKDNNLKSASAFSYNFNFGLAYRWYMTDNSYIGLRAKYNIVDYSLSKVIDFTGNPITVQFTIGHVGILDMYGSDYLKRLKYTRRK